MGFGGGGEFLFNIYSIARDVLAALAQEEPDENENRATENKQAVLNRIRPAGSEENKRINDAKTDGVEIAASQNDFFGKRKVAPSK